VFFNTIIKLFYRSVQFNEEVEVKTLVEGIGGSNSAPAEVVEISEERIDYVMSLLHEADPVILTLVMKYIVTCRKLSLYSLFMINDEKFFNSGNSHLSFWYLFSDSAMFRVRMHK
jgi:hypothetical protein